jgi:FkbM family methyltransferase
VNQRAVALPEDVASTSAEEARLRLLHDLIGNLREGPQALKAYVELLRSMRERLHPVGVADYRLVATAGGRFRVNLGDRLGSDFYYGYDAERTDAEVFRALIDEGDVVVDVGANFGFYTVLTAVAAGCAGAVHAFEPDPDAYGLLTENIALNGLDNVRLHNACVGAADGEANFYVMEESAFSGLSQTGRARLRDTIKVRMRRLDSVLADEGAATVTRLKIDVEGHEHEVLAGARSTVGRSRDVIIVMMEVSAKNLNSERRAMLEAEVRQLSEDGFRGWVVCVDARGERRLQAVADIAGLQSANVFLAQQGSLAEARLRDAVLRVEAPSEFRDGPAVPPAVRDREARTAAIVAEQLCAVRDREAQIGALIAELGAARTELRDLTTRFEVRLGALMRRLGKRLRG